MTSLFCLLFYFVFTFNQDIRYDMTCNRHQTDEIRNVFIKRKWHSVIEPKCNVTRSSLISSYCVLFRPRVSWANFWLYSRIQHHISKRAWLLCTLYCRRRRHRRDHGFFFLSTMPGVSSRYAICTYSVNSRLCLCSKTSELFDTT